MTQFALVLRNFRRMKAEYVQTEEETEAILHGFGKEH